MFSSRLRLRIAAALGLPAAALSAWACAPAPTGSDAPAQPTAVIEPTPPIETAAPIDSAPPLETAEPVATSAPTAEPTAPLPKPKCDPIVDPLCPGFPVRGKGRPFRPDGASHTAATSKSERWLTPIEVKTDLDASVRERLVAQWLEDAALEHASVAAFSLVSLQLAHLGAPPELLRLVHHAAVDEVEHARLCYALASAYADQALGPAALPLHGLTAEAFTLERLLLETFEDGCLGETTASLIAHESALSCEDPEVARILHLIAEDEARHAELAWRMLAWLLKVGGEDAAVLLKDRVSRLPSASSEHADDGPLARHGRLSTERQAALSAHVAAEIARPCAEALLSSRRGGIGVAELDRGGVPSAPS